MNINRGTLSLPSKLAEFVNECMNNGFARNQFTYTHTNIYIYRCLYICMFTKRCSYTIQ